MSRARQWSLRDAPAQNSTLVDSHGTNLWAGLSVLRERPVRTREALHPPGADRDRAGSGDGVRVPPKIGAVLRGAAAAAGGALRRRLLSRADRQGRTGRDHRWA